MKYPPFGFALIFAAGPFTGFIFGQGTGPGPAPRFEISLRGSGTGGGDTDFAGVSRGEVETRIVQFSAATRGRLTDKLLYKAGVGFEGTELDLTGGTPLPERLRATYVEFGATYLRSREWAVIAALQPGVYTDDEASSSDGFNVPGILLAQWKGAQWTFGGGIRFSPLDDSPVLPIAFARWQPNETWALSLGAPRTEVSYALNAETSFFAGGSFAGGTYAVDARRLTTPAGYPRLDETKLDYREIRVGAGVRHRVSQVLNLELEAGTTVDRSFDYFDRNLKVKAEDAGFLALSVVATF
jgi:hypothetical protein